MKVILHSSGSLWGRKVCWKSHQRINDEEKIWPEEVLCQIQMLHGLRASGSMLNIFITSIKWQFGYEDLLGLVGTRPDQGRKVIPTLTIWWASTSVTAAVVRLLNLKHHQRRQHLFSQSTWSSYPPLLSVLSETVKVGGPPSNLGRSPTISLCGHS